MENLTPTQAKRVAIINDIDRLQHYAATIKSIPLPGCETEDARDITYRAWLDTTAVVLIIKAKIETMKIELSKL